MTALAGSGTETLQRLRHNDVDSKEQAQAPTGVGLVTPGGHGGAKERDKTMTMIMAILTLLAVWAGNLLWYMRMSVQGDTLSWVSPSGKKYPLLIAGGGFNPRLAPFVVTKSIMVRESSNDAAAAQHFPVYKFPFAGQLLSAYANVRKVQPSAAAVDAAQLATTNTGVNEVSLWKHATADTTATYVTALRAAARTGNQNSTLGGGLTWKIHGTSAEPTMYTLTNKSAARRKFLAGDVVMMHFLPYAATNSHRQHVVDIQMNFMIGHEAS